ncbi:hypothetical protein GPECTOR_3g414 [Gonium pectorale]|uniref:Uncharacterized protein n=1 Tax=Gonium pectorale TaxID=33097 RepID=A0A150GZD0_GONPE|nr:hypothetical protein GPECTOR_3g414 [Gonium pectorale]|eukprot:KXZ55277.1 hypothetical protein GPECTOR_3g414 [Gonium pectorale]
MRFNAAPPLTCSSPGNPCPTISPFLNGYGLALRALSDALQAVAELSTLQERLRRGDVILAPPPELRQPVAPFPAGGQRGAADPPPRSGRLGARQRHDRWTGVWTDAGGKPGGGGSSAAGGGTALAGRTVRLSEKERLYHTAKAKAADAAAAAAGTSVGSKVVPQAGGGRPSAEAAVAPGPQARLQVHSVRVGRAVGTAGAGPAAARRPSDDDASGPHDQREGSAASAGAGADQHSQEEQRSDVGTVAGGSGSGVAGAAGGRGRQALGEIRRMVELVEAHDDVVRRLHVLRVEGPGGLARWEQQRLEAAAAALAAAESDPEEGGSEGEAQTRLTLEEVEQRGRLLRQGAQAQEAAVDEAARRCCLYYHIAIIRLTQLCTGWDESRVGRRAGEPTWAVPGLRQHTSNGVPGGHSPAKEHYPETEPCRNLYGGGGATADRRSRVEADAEAAAAVAAASAGYNRYMQRYGSRGPMRPLPGLLPGRGRQPGSHEAHPPPPPDPWRTADPEAVRKVLARGASTPVHHTLKSKLMEDAVRHMYGIAPPEATTAAGAPASRGPAGDGPDGGAVPFFPPAALLTNRRAAVHEVNLRRHMGLPVTPDLLVARAITAPKTARLVVRAVGGNSGGSGGGDGGRAAVPAAGRSTSATRAHGMVTVGQMLEGAWGDTDLHRSVREALHFLDGGRGPPGLGGTPPRSGGQVAATGAAVKAAGSVPGARPTSAERRRTRSHASAGVQMYRFRDGQLAYTGRRPPFDSTPEVPYHLPGWHPRPLGEAWTKQDAERLAGAVSSDARGNTELHWAAGRGDVGKVAELLAAAGDAPARREAANRRNQSGETPLHRAATCPGPRALGAVELLLAAGAEVDARDVNGATPLMGIITSGCWLPEGNLRARALLAAGASVTACDAAGETLLHKASSAIIHNVCKSNVGPSTPGGSSSPARGATDLAGLLEMLLPLAAQEHIHAYDYSNDGDEGDRSEAAIRGTHEGRSRVGGAGGRGAAGRGSGGGFSRTHPMAVAAAAGTSGALVATAVAVAAAAARSGPGAQTPAGARAQPAAHKPAARCVDCRDARGRTALHMACSRPHVHGPSMEGCCVVTLLAAGADPNAEDDGGRRPLHWVLSEAAQAARLREANAINHAKLATSRPKQPAGALCWVAEQLLLAGADPSAPEGPGGAGLTPLHLAAQARSKPLLRLLLRHGADPRVTDRAGRTAADVLQAAHKVTRDRQEATELAALLELLSKADAARGKAKTQRAEALGAARSRLQKATAAMGPGAGGRRPAQRERMGLGGGAGPKTLRELYRERFGDTTDEDTDQARRAYERVRSAAAQEAELDLGLDDEEVLALSRGVGFKVRRHAAPGRGSGEGAGGDPGAAGSSVGGGGAGSPGRYGRAGSEGGGSDRVAPSVGGWSATSTAVSLGLESLVGIQAPEAPPLRPPLPRAASGARDFTFDRAASASAGRGLRRMSSSRRGPPPVPQVSLTPDGQFVGDVDDLDLLDLHHDGEADEEEGGEGEWGEGEEDDASLPSGIVIRDDSQAGGEDFAVMFHGEGGDDDGVF